MKICSENLYVQGLDPAMGNFLSTEDIALTTMPYSSVQCVYIFILVNILFVILVILVHIQI